MKLFSKKIAISDINSKNLRKIEVYLIKRAWNDENINIAPLNIRFELSLINNNTALYTLILN